LSRFSLTGKKKFFILQEENRVVEAIRAAEKRTSGEIRVFIESKCRYVDPIDRAAEVFFGLQMERTRDRNAVLIYVAHQHHQAAIFGDEEIHRKVGTPFWTAEVQKMLVHFTENDFADGLIAVIHDVGEVLSAEFPYEHGDKNELPDEIVFGQ
jgi:uncharacterized membrane protein